jgi:hypothetical protein
MFDFGNNSKRLSVWAGGILSPRRRRSLVLTAAGFVLIIFTFHLSSFAISTSRLREYGYKKVYFSNKAEPPSGRLTVDDVSVFTSFWSFGHIC